MSGSYSSLGFDPAPGDVPHATRMVHGVAGTARALEEIAALLSGAAEGAWRGQAAIAFRDLLSDEFRPKVDAAARSFSGAHRTLHDWVDTMRASQSRARSLEQQHAEAVRRARSAHVTVAGIPGPAAPTGTPLTAEQVAHEAERARARSRAGRDASAADAEVDRIEREARDLLREYEELGREAAARLQHAMDIAPDEPGFWQRLADGIDHALSELGELAADLRDWAVQKLEELAPLLRLIGDIAGALSTVVGLLALVPGLQLLAVPALVLGGVAVAAHYGAAVGETGSFWEAIIDGDVLLSAVGVALGLGGLTVGSRLAAAAPAVGSTIRAGTAAGRPAGYFQLATTNYAMAESELMLRTVRYHLTAADTGVTAQGARDDVATAGAVWRRQFGPLTQRPSAVA